MFSLDLHLTVFCTRITHILKMLIKNVRGFEYMRLTNMLPRNIHFLLNPIKNGFNSQPQRTGSLTKLITENHILQSDLCFDTKVLGAHAVPNLQIRRDRCRACEYKLPRNIRRGAAAASTPAVRVHMQLLDRIKINEPRL